MFDIFLVYYHEGWSLQVSLYKAGFNRCKTGYRNSFRWLLGNDPRTREAYHELAGRRRRNYNNSEKTLYTNRSVPITDRAKLEQIERRKPRRVPKAAVAPTDPAPAPRNAEVFELPFGNKQGKL